MSESTRPIDEFTPLTFEEFTGKIVGTEVPTYNNFHMFFVRGTWHQKKPELLRFQKENPELTEVLTNKITEAYDENSGALINENELFEDLYEAYLIFKSYGFEDDKLFS